MTKKNYLETLKSVLGCSILHYLHVHGKNHWKNNLAIKTNSSIFW